MAKRNQKHRKIQKREEGAVMILVMLVLILATAAATFAVHSTTLEVRAAGYSRQALQTQYIGETGAVSALDLFSVVGPTGILYALQQSKAMLTANMNTLYGEPGFAANKSDYRMKMSDFVTAARPTAPIETNAANDASLGRSQLQPDFLVDINDNYTYTRPIAGARDDGRGTLQYMGATVTSRGRSRSVTPGLPAAYDVRTYHEGANDARAQILAGPFSN